MKWGIALSDSIPENIRIFDITVRDGEQTSEVSLTPEEKLRVAKSIDKLGADVIEAGFAAASNREVVTEEVYSFARGVDEDIVITGIEAMPSGVNVLMTNYNELQLTEVS